MRIAITGHRPEQIEGKIDWIKDALRDAYKELGVTTVIQGMAAGVDLNSAHVAYLQGIPYWCAKPWKGHRPRNDDRKLYTKVLMYAEKVIDVNPSETYTGPWLYDERNQWMVDNAELVIAVWNGAEKGGTANCVRYALKTKTPLYVIDPKKGTSGHYG